ncbi:hypothetical protein chiPu_0033573, partial [Chiloscyllium punctatum]|nr:hypothetical protein [Chiloscyllium punctatum]
ADHLVDRAIGCGRVRAEPVDEAEQHQFGERDHHHADRCGNAEPQHDTEQGTVRPHGVQECRVERERMLVPQHVDMQPEQCHDARDGGGDRGARDAQHRQPEPAADQRGRHHEADDGRDRQRHQRRHGVTDATHHRREQQEREGHRHRNHHDPRIGHRGVEDVRRRGERDQERAG